MQAQCLKTGFALLGATAQSPARHLDSEFSVRKPKNAREYTKYCLRFLRILTKNSRAKLHTVFCAVAP
jgi:hypothetical protein